MKNLIVEYHTQRRRYEVVDFDFIDVPVDVRWEQGRRPNSMVPVLHNFSPADVECAAVKYAQRNGIQADGYVTGKVRYLEASTRRDEKPSLLFSVLYLKEISD